MAKDKKIAIIAGARPNFMKVAPLCHELKKCRIPFILINTGQHFSSEMSRDFLREFKLKPNYSLKPSKTSQEAKMLDIKKGLEQIFSKENPCMVVVVGDVNSTLWSAKVAHKMKIKLAHIEAGLRSFNNKMPEEHNRIQTDKLSDLLFVTQEEGMKNLREEKVLGRAYFVGNIMIDTLKMFSSRVEKQVKDKKYYFCTLHRAENVDNRKVFNDIVSALEVIGRDAPIYLPLHPRTKKQAKKFSIIKRLYRACTILAPLSYSESVSFQKYSKLVLTDSGGVQEETSFLGIPCITLRTETERPITVVKGTNIIGGVSERSILKAYRGIDFKKRKTRIKYWDGKTAQRIAKIIKNSI